MEEIGEDRNGQSGGGGAAARVQATFGSVSENSTTLCFCSIVVSF